MSRLAPPKTDPVDQFVERLRDLQRQINAIRGARIGRNLQDQLDALAGRTGTATLVAGTVTVADTDITAASLIYLARYTAAGTRGALYVDTKTAGASFVIKSTSATDTSVVHYRILEA